MNSNLAEAIVKKAAPRKKATPEMMTFAHFQRLALNERQRTFKVEDLIEVMQRESVKPRVPWTLDPIQQQRDLLVPLVPSMALLLRQLLSRPRKNQKDLTQSEKNAFNSALQSAEADGSYARITAIHTDKSHRMHSSMGGGFVGGMRFLPWHRVYCFILEQQLQMHQPDIQIPYWDWANDHTLPSWVYLPSGVTRGPDTSWSLPTQGDIDALNQTNYVNFVYDYPKGLEEYHNTVHMWVGGNTMPYPMQSPNDPMFWLHHANVDRIWAEWQVKNPSVLPPLSGGDAFMDPWSWMSLVVVNDTYNWSYYYV
jgi:Common central domain of tyrosinase